MRAFSIVLAGLLLGLVGCQEGRESPSAAAPRAQASDAKAGADDAIATVGGVTIKRGALEQHVKAKLIEVENSRYEALKEGLDELVADELVKQEAAARSITPDA